MVDYSLKPKATKKDFDSTLQRMKIGIEDMVVALQNTTLPEGKVMVLLESLHVMDQEIDNALKALK